MSLEFLTPIYPQMVAETQAVLEQFKQQSGITVQANFQGWDAIWRELVNTGIYKQGADVSEVGTSWLESISAMKALRPFSTFEVQMLGGENAFLPATWSAGRVNNGREVLGIPVRSDTRMIWYWKDMLTQAGVDPLEAFASFDALAATLEKLKTVCDTPLGLGTSTADGLPAQILASWLWQGGGDYISPDGKGVLFAEPGALERSRAHFDLYRYLPQKIMTGFEVAEAFMQRKFCMIIGGPWFYTPWFQQTFPPEVFANLGYANIPGPAFVGGTVLVIWKHCVVPDQAFKFVQFMTSARVQSSYPQLIGLTAARQDVWNTPPMSTDPYYRMVYHALSSGRSYPTVPLWGMIEDRLLKTISGIWYELFSQPNPNVDQVVTKQMTSLARRLKISIDQYASQGS